MLKEIPQKSKGNRMSMKTEAARSGFGLGAMIAVAISWSVHKSILWAILHGFLGWIYVVYVALFH